MLNEDVWQSYISAMRSRASPPSSELSQYAMDLLGYGGSSATANRWAQGAETCGGRGIGAKPV